MGFLGLARTQKQQLEYEIVPFEARLQLTRLLRLSADSVRTDYSENDKGWNLRMNSIINICRNQIGFPVAMVDIDEFGESEYFDAGWLRSELEVSMRRPDTTDLIETLADLIQGGWVENEAVNEIFRRHSVGVRFDKQEREVHVRVLPVEEIEDEEYEEIANIRQLIRRMEVALQEGDYPNVLHASASIFETLAKDVFKNPNVEDKPLGSFFEGYRKKSRLPDQILDYVKEIYDRRNKEPLAGHGQTVAPSISQENAISLAELTKAFVKIERKIGLASISPPKS